MNSSNDNNYSATWQLFISKGNEEAFSLLYFYHYDMMYYCGLKYVSDIQIIEDSIQNVFIYLLKNRQRLKPVVNVKGYLLKSFRRQLFLDLKKRNRNSPHDKLGETKFDYFNSTEQDYLDEEELNEMQIALKNCITKLSAKQQEIIYLRYDCELSYEEISKILEISVDSCYKSIYRSIKTLKSEIGKMLGKGKDLFFWFIILNFKNSR